VWVFILIWFALKMRYWYELRSQLCEKVTWSNSGKCGCYIYSNLMQLPVCSEVEVYSCSLVYWVHVINITIMEKSLDGQRWLYPRLNFSFWRLSCRFNVTLYPSYLKTELCYQNYWSYSFALWVFAIIDDKSNDLCQPVMSACTVPVVDGGNVTVYCWCWPEVYGELC